MWKFLKSIGTTQKLNKSIYSGNLQKVDIQTFGIYETS